MRQMAKDCYDHKLRTDSSHGHHVTNGTTCNHLQEVGYHKSRYTCRLVIRLFSKRRRRFDGQEHSAINVHKTLDVAVGSLTDVVQTL